MDCVSPSRHAEFSDADSMLDWVEMLADETGLPVGIKSAVGDLGFWHELARLTADTGRGVDFVTIDGGEGGTGAAPLVFADSVSMPFRLGFSRVYQIFAEAGLHEETVFVGAGKLGLPDNAVVAFALGADMVNVGREAMLAIGCVQAQKCHTDRCPTGVDHAEPVAGPRSGPGAEVGALRRTTSGRCAATCSSSPRRPGVEHPGLIGTSARRDPHGADRGATPLHEVYGYDPAWGFPSRGRPHRDRPPDGGDGAAGQCRPRWRRDPARVGVDGRRLLTGGPVVPVRSTGRLQQGGPAPA